MKCRMLNLLLSRNYGTLINKCSDIDSFVFVLIKNTAAETFKFAEIIHLRLRLSLSRLLKCRLRLLLSNWLKCRLLWLSRLRINYRLLRSLIYVV